MRWIITFCLLLVACGGQPANDAGPHPINAVAGDASWDDLRGTDPSGASETERIRVHLEWVERELRDRNVDQFGAGASANRAALLDVLHDYRVAEVFPRHTATVSEGRAPRWVDDRGVHCAVAHLVAASGRTDLVDEVQQWHEYDYVPDMNVLGLVDWARTHGFTLRELAMIQPTYDDGGVREPTRLEEEEARRRAEAEAKIPRPLPPETLDRALEWYVNRDHKRACFGERTGEWELEASLTVGADLVPHARVQVTDVATGERDAKLSRCWTKRLRTVAKNHLSHKNYTVKKKVEAARKETVVVPTRRQVFEAFFAHDIYDRHHEESRLEALAACLESWPADEFPLRVAVEVASWNGHIVVDFAPTGYPLEKTLSLPNEVQQRLHCVGDILRYGSISPRPLHDVTFVVAIKRDGGMSVSE
jgi:hypothetical protein